MQRNCPECGNPLIWDGLAHLWLCTACLWDSYSETEEDESNADGQE